MSDSHRPLVPPGWHAAFPEHLPKPTAAPGMFAFGLTLLAWGLISSPLLCLMGGVVLFYALLHWVGEIWHDAK